MRVKQTAKKISNDNPNDVINPNNSINVENSDHNSCDNQNDISDSEVEILVECRRDKQGNQVLLDGTLVIEPAPVDTSEYKENDSSNKDSVASTKEINFNDFIKELQGTMPETDQNKVSQVPSTVKKTVTNFDPIISNYSSVKCTACTTKYNPFIGQTLFKHPLMEVLLCSNCIQNQKDEFFVVDNEDNKETLCRWCVEGGSLICCDFCAKSFCKTCIKRNLGRTMLSEILTQDDSVQWKCFVCDPKPIESLKATCRKVYEDVRIFIDKRRFQKLSKKPIARITEIVNKKRSLSKAFPNDNTSFSPNMSSPKLPCPSTIITNPALKSGTLVHDMSTFGTDWYLRNVKLKSILSEIDEISPRTLLNAINSTKKCIEAFYSDIRNLETEINKSSTAADISEIVSMFKSVYRHHIFNRFCKVKSRIEEDKNNRFIANTTTKIDNETEKSDNVVVSTNVVSSSPSVSKVHNNQAATKMAASLSNGDSRLHFMESIDLTDEPERIDESLSLPTVISDHQQEENNATGIVSSTQEGSPQEIVDLCADEDSATIVESDSIIVHSTDNGVAKNGQNESLD